MSQNLNTNLKQPPPVSLSNLVGPTHLALTTPSLEVRHGTDVKPLVALMKTIMVDSHAIGLAANQIGVPQRIIIVRVGRFRETIINPIIIKRYGGIVSFVESSLSYPGLQVRIRRHKQIIVEGFTPDWKPIRRKLKGKVAICVQHDVDHLNGITIATIKSKGERREL